MQEKNPDIPKSIFTMTFTWRRNNNKENPKILQYIQRLRGPFFLSPVTCKVYPIFQIQIRYRVFTRINIARHIEWWWMGSNMFKLDFKMHLIITKCSIFATIISGSGKKNKERNKNFMKRKQHSIVWKHNAFFQ